MKKILHVSCSPRGRAAESYRLSQKIIGFLLQKEPTAVLVNRVIGGGAISHVDENYAISQQSSADISQEGTIARSEELIAEIESSDFVVIGTPMHNFTVPSALKAWIDHVVRARRTFKRSTSPLHSVSGIHRPYGRYEIFAGSASAFDIRGCRRECLDRQATQLCACRCAEMAIAPTRRPAIRASAAPG